jgi:ribosomal-protein-alanine N-acetyltransferase
MNNIINNQIFDKFPKLESERMLFREFQISDANDLFLIRSNNQVMKFMDTEKHKTINDSINLIHQVQESFKSQTGINWAIVEKSSNVFLGYFGYWRIMKEHCRAEIGFALKPEYWGKGFMTESLFQFVNFGFNNMQVHSIEANVNPLNKKSMLILEKVGFKKEAYFRENYLFNGKFIDSVIFSMIEPEK